MSSTGEPASPSVADASLGTLRAAMAELDDLGDASDTPEVAARYEAVHDALVAVLSDVDGSRTAPGTVGTGPADPGSPGEG